MRSSGPASDPPDLYRRHNLIIRKDDYGWKVAKLRKSSKGEETLERASYHPTLAVACIEAAHRIADESEARSLEEYAKALRGAVNELKGVGKR